MTVKELKEKLSLYKDDVEVFCGNYDDLLGLVSYSDPRVNQKEVDAHRYKDNSGWFYSKYEYRANRKKHTILVIG